MKIIRVSGYKGMGLLTHFGRAESRIQTYQLVAVYAQKDVPYPTFRSKRKKPYDTLCLKNPW